MSETPRQAVGRQLPIPSANRASHSSNQQGSNSHSNKQQGSTAAARETGPKT